MILNCRILLLTTSSSWGFVIVNFHEMFMIEKSTTEFVLLMGDYDFTWNSNKEAIITFYACKVEYMFATSCTPSNFACCKRRLGKSILINSNRSTRESGKNRCSTKDVSI